MPDEPTATPDAGAEKNQGPAAGQSTAGVTTAPTGPEAGKPAEENWQGRFEAQQKVNRDLEAKLKAALPKSEAEELRSKLAKFEGREAEYEAERARRALEDGALKKANERIRKAEVRAAAASLLKDPADALLYIDLDKLEVGPDGEMDASAVREALEGLVKSKPYLAAEGGAGPFIHSPTSSREGPTSKRQWTKADLQGKTPEQIATAKSEGLLKDLLAGTAN